MHSKDAASVLPLPVGALMNVFSATRMEGQPYA